MRVVHLNAHDIAGGAARAAYRLHTGLCRIGQDSSMFVRHRAADDPDVSVFRPRMDLLNRARRRLRRIVINRDFSRHLSTRPNGLAPFSDDRTQHANQIASQLPESDIVNLHWVSGFVDISAFMASTSMPLVWTLHDMNLFTGGCHYDEGCGRYAGSCGACPQLGSSEEADLSRQVWLRKHAAFEAIPRNRLHLVAPSEWLAAALTRSSLLGEFPASIIPNGVDTEVFAPRDRGALREAFGIPQDKTVVLFVAPWTSVRRKGFRFLLQALNMIRREENLLLVSVGRGKVDDRLSVPHLHLGSIQRERVLAMVYSLADLFVIPSLHDNLPNTVLESTACGTPVVGFDTGGIPDMVRPGITGLLAPVGDAHALGDAIAELLQDPIMRATMSSNCRRIAVDEYSLEVQARQYLELYGKMLDRGC